MKITNLKVQNFKAFYCEKDKPYEFDFLGKDGNAKNILLYGENGSGKSSLYWTLHHALTTTDTNTFKKYKNIFSKKEDKPIKIELNFDNGKNFIYEETTGIDIDASTQEEFDRLTKIKTFLTYDSIFLINELFTREISIERFISIINLLYGESLGVLLNEYNTARRKFKRDYLKKLCEFEELFKAFDEEHSIESYWEDIYIDAEYEDIPKWDKEENKPMYPFYETVYYYPDETIAELEHIETTLKTLQSDFDIQNEELDNIISAIEDIKETFEEKSESNYTALMEEEKLFVTDFEPIETVDELLTLNLYFEDVFEMIHEYKRGKGVVENLNTELNLKLDAQVRFINDLLQNHFKNGIEIKAENIDYFEFDLTDIDKFNPFRFEIKTANEDVPHRYAKFLNEAKISSINLAFYISIIKSYAELRELKLLVLDDLLISLDMSNRDIVLDILQEYFSDYQIIFLTHDRAFFEMARRKFETLKQDKNWIRFEMYEDSSDTIPKPLIIPSKSNFEKAEAYFKICDYATAGNYLRKASEEILSSMLLDTFKPNDKSGLDGMIQAYKAMCTAFSIEISPYIPLLEELTKRVFNPSSHDDLVSPLYKKEVYDAIELVRNIAQLEKIEKHNTTIKQGSLLAFKYEGKYESFYRFLGEVPLYTYAGQILNRDSILLCKTGHKELIDGEWKECTYGNNESFTLKKIFGRNKHHCETTLGLTTIDTGTFLDNVLINDSALEIEVKSLIQKQIGEE